MQYGRDMDRQLADGFAAMYVNELRLEYGERGRATARRLITLGYERGIIPHRVEVEFAE